MPGVGAEGELVGVRGPTSLWTSGAPACLCLPPLLDCVMDFVSVFSLNLYWEHFSCHKHIVNKGNLAASEVL